MKNPSRILGLIIILLLAYSDTSKGVTSDRTKAKEIVKTSTFKDQLTVEDILTKRRIEIESKLERKLKIKEQFVLGVIKRKLKRAKKAGRSDKALNTILQEDQSTFNAGALLLGFFQSFIGVGIAHLILGKEKARASWLGAFTAFAIFAMMVLTIVGVLVIAINSLKFNTGLGGPWW